VPYHVGRACAQQYLQGGFAKKNVADCIMNVLTSLVGKAVNLRIHSLVLATIQQLQESGLLEQLPSMLSAVAAGLTAAQTGLPHACLSEAHRAMKQQLGSASVSSAAQFSDKLDCWVSCLVLIARLLRQMTAMLRQPDVTGRTYNCPEVLTHKHALALADIVLALARDISANLGADSSRRTAMFNALVMACEYLQELCGLYVHCLLPRCDSPAELLHDVCLKPDVQQVLLSSSLGPSLALVLAAVAHTWPAEQQQARNVQAEGSSSGCSLNSSSDASVTRAVAKAERLAALELAWQQGKRQAASLPSSHLQLWTPLGIDVRLVVALGGMMQVQHSTQDADVILSDLLFETWMKIVDIWQSSPTRVLWQQKPAAQQELELHLQLLLPRVLLHCATKMPRQAASRRYYENCVHAAQQSISGVSAWTSLTQAPGSLEQQQQQPRPRQLEAAWVAEVVPAALKLARRLLSQLQEDADSASGAASAVVGAVNGSSTTSRQGMKGFSTNAC
jgi:hypothetical protein